MLKRILIMTCCLGVVAIFGMPFIMVYLLANLPEEVVDFVYVELFVIAWFICTFFILIGWRNKE